jgi:fumarate reductase subunit D
MRWVSRLEPLWWGLFAIGGTIAAFLLPVHVFLNNIAIPLGWFSPQAVSYQHLAGLLGNPWVKAYLIIFLTPVLFHAAHRLKSLPHELVLPGSPRLLGTWGYLAAIALSVTCIVVVVLGP